MLAEKHNDPNSIPTLEQFCSDMNEVSSTKASRCLYYYVTSAVCCVHREREESAALLITPVPLHSAYENRTSRSS